MTVEFFECLDSVGISGQTQHKATHELQLAHSRTNYGTNYHKFATFLVEKKGIIAAAAVYKNCQYHRAKQSSHPYADVEIHKLQ